MTILCTKSFVQHKHQEILYYPIYKLIQHETKRHTTLIDTPLVFFSSPATVYFAKQFKLSFNKANLYFAPGRTTAELASHLVNKPVIFPSNKESAVDAFLLNEVQNSPTTTVTVLCGEPIPKFSQAILAKYLIHYVPLYRRVVNDLPKNTELKKIYSTVQYITIHTKQSIHILEKILAADFLKSCTLLYTNTLIKDHLLSCGYTKLAKLTQQID